MKHMQIDMFIISKRKSQSKHGIIQRMSAIVAVIYAKLMILNKLTKE